MHLPPVFCRPQAELAGANRNGASLSDEIQMISSSFISKVHCGSLPYSLTTNGDGQSRHADMPETTISAFPLALKGTESQNCMGWKGPQEIIKSNPPAKANSLQQVAQVGIQTGLEYLQRRRLNNQPGHPVQCSVTFTMKKFFHMLVWNFLCSIL